MSCFTCQTHRSKAVIIYYFFEQFIDNTFSEGYSTRLPFILSQSALFNFFSPLSSAISSSETVVILYTHLLIVPKVVKSLTSFCLNHYDVVEINCHHGSCKVFANFFLNRQDFAVMILSE